MAGWHAEDIKGAIRKKFGTIRLAGAQLGVSQPTISAVLSDAGRSMRVERLIAEAIGIPLHELWPERWHRDGTPKARNRPSSYVTRTPQQSQKSEAA